ncbi:MAG TPA: saccharopine dehydrogenase NADP-binding domain-containing protein [candidate division Zixibacteria bacterium]|nr:saccharopine dehydrogenase NADP-binding domain-containing protein [candidate division Zixibacteria bacterium]
MSRIVVLGGAGIIGSAIVQDLADDIAEVVVADLDLAVAAEVAAKIGGGCVAVQVDVTNPEKLDDVLSGADACINSVQYYFNLEVMAGCLRNKVPYIDLGGLFYTTRKQLKLAGDFEAAGLTAVLGLGSCPGVANVHAGYMGKMLDAVDSVKIFNGATVDEGESLSWAYSIETILDEIYMGSMIFRDGAFQEKEPLSEEEFFMFPEPIGYAKTHLSLHSEVATIPLSLAEKGIQECFFKITFFGYSEPVLRKMQFLAEIGFASTEPLNVKGVEVAPRDVLTTLLKQAPAAHEPPVSKGYKDIATVVEGTQDGKPVTLRMDTWAWPHKRWGMSGGKLMVASPPAIVARWLADGRLNRPGVWAPEQVVDGDMFFADLTDRGIGTALDRQERLY